MNYTYILECKDGTYYTGWTNNLEKRLKDHNDGKGAKYTKARRPVVLIYHERFETKEEAMRREYAIKHMTRKEKEKLIENKSKQILNIKIQTNINTGIAFLSIFFNMLRPALIIKIATAHLIPTKA